MNAEQVSNAPLKYENDLILRDLIIQLAIARATYEVAQKNYTDKLLDLIAYERDNNTRG